MGITRDNQDPTKSYKRRLTGSYSHTKWILPKQFKDDEKEISEILSEKMIETSKFSIKGKLGASIFDRMANSLDELPSQADCHLCKEFDNVSNMLFCDACKCFFDNACISKEIEKHLNKMMYGSKCPVKNCDFYYKQRELKFLVGNEIHQLLENLYSFLIDSSINGSANTNFDTCQCECKCIFSINTNEEKQTAANHFMFCKMFYDKYINAYKKLSEIFMFQLDSKYRGLSELNLIVLKVLFYHFVDEIYSKNDQTRYLIRQNTSTQGFSLFGNTFFSGTVSQMEEIQGKCECCNKEHNASDIFHNKKCKHNVHTGCIKQKVIDHIVSLSARFRCPNLKCDYQYSDSELRSVIHPELYDKLASSYDLIITGLLTRDYETVSCAKCETSFIFEPGSTDMIIKAPRGKQLTEAHKLNYVTNRFKCPNKKCKIEQCKTCKAIPFHLGFTCEQFKNYKPCRYCEDGVDLSNPNQNFPDICMKNPECIGKANEACQSFLSCKHRCSGVTGEFKHPPCLYEECLEKLKDPINETCMVCNDTLTSAPCLKLSNCNHFYHIKCILERLKQKYSGNRVTFNYLDCPGCRQEYQPNM